MEIVRPRIITATHIELISSTKGFVQGRATDVALFNRWWDRCKKSRFPYIRVVKRRKEKMDLRFETEPMDLPYPELPCRLTAEDQGELWTLFAESCVEAEWCYVDQDGAGVGGIDPEHAATLSAAILAIVFRGAE